MSAGGAGGRSSGERRAAARWRCWLAAAGYVAVFVAVFWSWLRAADSSFATGNHPLDSRIIAWVQAWLARTLPVAPGRIFDAPIHYPAPDQLTGAESFLSSQVVFAPLYWISGNAVLATSLVAMLSYPLAAFAMERLLAALGIGAAAAWVAGLAFALGPLRVPASVQVLQYLNLYLPLVALAIEAARRTPDLRRAVAFAAVLAMAAFSSFYTALLIAIVGAGWTCLVLLRRGAGRLACVLALGVPACLVLVALWGFSRPYAARRAGIDALRREIRAHSARPEVQAAGAPGERRAGALETASPPAGAEPRQEKPWASITPGSQWALFWDGDPRWLVAVAVAGSVALLRASPPVRRTATAGLCFVAIGAGATLGIVRFGLPAPVAAVLAFFRFFWRLQVITGFGVALLVAAALDAVRSVLGWRLQGAVCVAVGVAVVAAQGRGLVAQRLDRVAAMGEHLAVYRMVGQIAAAEGGGALLELPETRRPKSSLVPDAMIGNTIHGLPLITGYSAFPPFHALLVEPLLRRLPARDALAELVDLTGVRWILLRPIADWQSPGERERFAAELAAAAGAPARELDGFVLQEVELSPARPGWLEALRAGPRPGRSPLGAALAQIPQSALLAEITVEPPGAALAGRRGLWLPVLLRNLGSATWPGGLTRPGAAAGEVLLDVRWARGGAVAASSAPALPEPLEVGLRRDVSSGDLLRQDVLLVTPDEPGSYTIEIRMRQRGGARFERGLEASGGVAVEVLPAT